MNKYYKNELIEDFIKQRGWSINKFCKECNIGYKVYKKIINQQLNFRLSALFKIAKVMRVHVCQLCCNNYTK